MLLQTPQRTGRRPHPFNATSVAASFCNQWASSRNAGGSICFFVRKCKKKSPFAWTFMGLEPIDNDTVALGAWRLTDILDNLRDDPP